MSLMRPFALLALACAAAAGAGAGGRSAPECPNPSFEGHRDVVEAARMEESADPCWWLSSGALLSIDSGVARTVQGALAPDSEWRLRYADSSKVDTDDGAHPQNLLRLVTRWRWADAREELRFRIKRLNLSGSAERGEWSGVLLFLRYVDSDNLYYAGLRMDGTAVIKKKIRGRYVTLAQQPVFGSADAYDRDHNPSLLPAQRWVGLAGTIRTQPDGSVRVELFVQDAEPTWRLVAQAVDTGHDGAAIRGSGHGGIRADFMDIEFADFAATAEPNRN